jgi:hypothetical protein
MAVTVKDGHRSCHPFGHLGGVQTRHTVGCVALMACGGGPRRPRESCWGALTHGHPTRPTLVLGVRRVGTLVNGQVLVPAGGQVEVPGLRSFLIRF